MIKNKSIDKLKKSALDAEAVATSGVFLMDDALKLKGLFRKLKAAIEASAEEELDYIDVTIKSFQKTARAEAKAYAKKRPKDKDAEGRKFRELVQSDEGYAECLSRQDDLYEREIAFGLDNPIELPTIGKNGKDLAELMPDFVQVSYRTPPINVPPMKALFDLEEEGYIKFKKAGKSKTLQPVGDDED